MYKIIEMENLDKYDIYDVLEMEWVLSCVAHNGPWEMGWV